jgi:hypothetical protein
MSNQAERRIALVAEGPTDYYIVEAALRAILPHPFVLVLLQPEATRPSFEQGWCGVLKWCHDAAFRYVGLLEEDPLLPSFDMLIIHLDVDVAARSYDDCGQQVAALAGQLGWLPLPCELPCPPAGDSASALLAVLQSWLGSAVPGPRTVICFPAQSSGTWLAAAHLPASHALLAQSECDPSLESGLARLPLSQRIRKRVPEYRTLAPEISARWAEVKARCTQAGQFEQAVQAVP